MFPETPEQRCWVHKTKIESTAQPAPRRRQDGHRRHLQRRARADALTAGKALGDQFAEFPKATAKITDDLEVLLAFHDFPIEHWLHLRTTNPIESTFSTVRVRTKVTRGAG